MASFMDFELVQFQFIFSSFLWWKQSPIGS